MGVGHDLHGGQRLPVPPGALEDRRHVAGQGLPLASVEVLGSSRPGVFLSGQPPPFCFWCVCVIFLGGMWNQAYGSSAVCFAGHS